MSVEAVIGLADQFPVEPFFADPRFIARNQQDRFSLCVESESYSPHSTRCVEPQFFHVLVTRSLQRVNARPSKLWTELLQKARQSQNFRPHVLVQRVEFRLKLIADLNKPAHFL